MRSWPKKSSFQAMLAVSLLILAGLWGLNRVGFTRWACYGYLLLLIAATSALFAIEDLDRLLILYAVPTLTASFLISPRASFFFAALSVLGYSLTYFLQDTPLDYNYIAVPTLLLLAFIAWLIAGRLERALDRARQDLAARQQAEEEAQQRAEALTALHETALDLAGQRELPDLLRAIVARAVDLLGAKAGGIYLYRPATDDLEYVCTYPENPHYSGIVLKRGEGLSGKVLVSAQPMAVADYKNWQGRSEQFAQDDFAASVAVPIRWGERMLGVLDLDDETPRAFSADDIALLERFAPLAAAALETHHLLQDLQRQMERLKATQAQLVQSARMAAIGTLAAGVAHEINNPMTSVMGFAEVMLDELPASFDMRKELEIIVNEARRITRIVRNLLDFARQTPPQRRPTDLNEILRQTLTLTAEHLARSGVEIEVVHDSEIAPLPLDEGQMKQVFLNLITNAAQAMPAGGRLGIQSSRKENGITVTVADTGAGIPPEVQRRLFEPFFTTKDGGTGLGLSLSLGIVQEHGGEISVESEEGKGSTFTVWLPTNPDAAPPT